MSGISKCGPIFEAAFYIFNHHLQEESDTFILTKVIQNHSEGNMSVSAFRKAKQLAYVCLAVVLFQTSLLAQAFAEDACDDLWYSRNFYFDQAGYCFGSKLGKAVFDNSNCKSKNVSLTAPVKYRINQMKKIEAVWECKINTGRVRTLNIPQFDLRKNLVVQPISQGFESSCFGYLGTKQVPLYSAMSENSKIIGHAELGDDVIAAHEEVDQGDWWFASVSHKNGTDAIGWTNATIFGNCKAMAG